MSRMGAEGYSSAGKTRLSAKVPETLKEDFKDACENVDVTMTDAIEEKMTEFVAEHGSLVLDDTEYYPSDPSLRDLYEVSLDVSDDGPQGPTIYQRRHAGEVARRTQQVAKNELSDAMMRLRREGYAVLGPMPPELQGQAAERWRCWILKPACADPEQWKFRED